MEQSAKRDPARSRNSLALHQGYGEREQNAALVGRLVAMT
jgi:hypothetical protein